MVLSSSYLCRLLWPHLRAPSTFSGVWYISYAVQILPRSFLSATCLFYLLPHSQDGNQGSKKTTSAGPEKILMLPSSLG
jgi:hypothetical protein